MAGVWEALGMSEETPADRLAYDLADQDAQLKIDLVQAREDRGMSQQDVADRLGVTQATVSAFERYDNDPKLSTIRRYALAVGAQVCHSVDLVHADNGAEWRGAGSVHLSVSVRPSEPRAGWVLAS